MSEWISVENELPENEKMVLVLSEAYRPENHLNQKSSRWIFQGKFSRSKGWTVYFNQNSDTVTHWMPLPELPK